MTVGTKSAALGAAVGLRIGPDEGVEEEDVIEPGIGVGGEDEGVGVVDGAEVEESGGELGEDDGVVAKAELEEAGVDLGELGEGVTGLEEGQGCLLRSSCSVDVDSGFGRRR